MRIAVICLAHLAMPAGVAGLARYFARLDATLYMHVDAKVPDDAYRDLASCHANLHLLGERLPIWWGGFNMVGAAIAGLRQARASGPYDRYLLVSEDSVPLLPPAGMAAQLAGDAEFLDANPVPADPANPVRRRYEGWYSLDDRATSARFIEAPERAIDDAFLARMQRLQALRAKGKYKLPGLWHGSQWWGLTADAVTRVLDVHDRRHWLRNSFEFSLVPDEQYIQTIVAASFAGRVFQPFMYADFSRAPKPFVYRSAAELAALAGGYCMARKVDLAAPGIADHMRAITEG